MPAPVALAVARLHEIRLPDADNPTAEAVNPGASLPVQFNPETLRVAYQNTVKGDEQAAGAAVQFVSKSSTKLTVTLWFDVTVDVSLPGQDTGPVNDVRKLTQRVNHFLVPQPEGDQQRPPGTRFQWGSFLFDGIVDSMDETLELFSADGRPLRAQVALSMASPSIQFEFADPATVAASPGTVPTAPVRGGESVQQAVARGGGRPRDWRGVAAANDIENPRFPGAGTRLIPGAGTRLRRASA